MSNKCTHLNVSLVGKTPLLQGKVRCACMLRASRLVQARTSECACVCTSALPCRLQVEGKCIVCPAHGTAFDLATGAPHAWDPCVTPELPPHALHGPHAWHAALHVRPNTTGLMAACCACTYQQSPGPLLKFW